MPIKNLGDNRHGLSNSGIITVLNSFKGIELLALDTRCNITQIPKHLKPLRPTVLWQQMRWVSNVPKRARDESKELMPPLRWIQMRESEAEFWSRWVFVFLPLQSEKSSEAFGFLNREGPHLFNLLNSRGLLFFFKIILFNRGSNSVLKGLDD